MMGRYTTAVLIIIIIVFIGVGILEAKMVDQKDIGTFYRGKISALFSAIRHWGWIYGFYGIIPFVIPIIPLTTIYNTTLVFRILMFIILVIIMGALSSRCERNKILNKIWWVVSILLIIIPTISPEYERFISEDFQNRNELITFLHNDNTDSITYTDDFVCEDFSRVLIRRGRDSGYRLYFYSTKVKNPSHLRLWEEPDYVNHALCKAYIISEDKWVEVEPQTDGIDVGW